MNYSDLKQIVHHLKKAVPCSNCKKKFENEEFEVLSTFGNEGLFHLYCHKCRNQLLVHVAIVHPNQKKKPLERERGEFKKPHTQTQIITPNEILDMHIFLDRFNGDFKKLFTLP
jgi:hypothetical protein